MTMKHQKRIGNHGGEDAAPAPLPSDHSRKLENETDRHTMETLLGEWAARHALGGIRRTELEDRILRALRPRDSSRGQR